MKALLLFIFSLLAALSFLATLYSVLVNDAQLFCASLVTLAISIILPLRYLD